MHYIGRLFKALYSKKVLVPILAIIVFHTVFLRGGADLSQVETAKVRKGDIASEVSSSGLVSSASESDLKFAVSGRVASVSVGEGDTVVKGQVIATLDKEKYEIALRQANQDVVAADAELEKVYDTSKKDNFEDFNEKIIRTAAEAKKNKAFDSMKAAQRSLKDTVLISPISGSVVNLDIKPLEEVVVAAAVGKVVDTSSGVSFTAEVDETEISKVSLGQKAEIILDAFEEDGVESDVIKIGEQNVVTSTGATAYEVELTFPSDSKYKVGMNGEARIVTDESKATLILPFDALVDDKFVWIKKESGYEKKEVEKGLESDLDFEVRNGLVENDEVVTAGFEELEKKNLLQKILSRS